MTKLTWDNNPALKAQAVADMQQHADLDEIIGGVYQAVGRSDQFKGCFIGCLLPRQALHQEPMWINIGGNAADWYVPVMPAEGWQPKAAETFGLPVDLVYAAEGFFEQAHPRGSAEQVAFAVAMVQAIPVGVSYDLVKAVANKWWRDYEEKMDPRAWAGCGCCRIGEWEPPALSERAKFFLEELAMLGDPA